MHAVGNWDRYSAWRPRLRRNRPFGAPIAFMLLALFVGHQVVSSGSAPLLAIGVVLLVLGLRRHRFGLIIAAGVLLGLTAGQYLAAATGLVAPELRDAARMFGLAGGFGLVYWSSLEPEMARHPARWASLVGATLFALAVINVVLGFTALTWRLIIGLGAWWPLLLIATGGALVLTQLVASRRQRVV